MPRSGSGAYAIPTTLVAGTTALASEVNGNFSDIGDEIADSLSRSGKGGMQADLDMGSHKVTGLADPTDGSDAATKDYADSVGAATDAQYLVGLAHAGLTAERVVTDTATVAWDLGTAGQAKAAVPDDAITYAKMQNVSATDKLLGRSTSGAGDVEEIACTAAGRALLDDASAAAQRTTLGIDIFDVQNADGSTLTDMPIGHFVLVEASLSHIRNSTMDVWINSGNSRDYIDTASGSQMAGTWRARGGILIAGSVYILAQRVA